MRRGGDGGIHWVYQDLTYFNPIQIGLFWLSLDWDGGGASNASLYFLKTIKYIDMKLTPLIKHRKINLLQLSYLSCDVTKVLSWIYMAARHLGFSNLSKLLKLIFLLQICWITSLDNIYSLFCRFSSETSTKIEMKTWMDQIWPEQGSRIQLPWQHVN